MGAVSIKPRCEAANLVCVFNLSLYFALHQTALTIYRISYLVTQIKNLSERPLLIAIAILSIGKPLAASMYSTT